MHSIRTEQYLPIPLKQAWDFFATPRNLNIVTPKELDFVITSDLPERMYEGLIIRYKIRPMLKLRIEWVTEITHIHAMEYFTDEQRKGPYKIWHHEHHFREAEGGVIMTDILHYDIGKSLFGWIAGKLFVHRKVRQIFDYRERALKDFFGFTSSP